MNTTDNESASLGNQVRSSHPREDITITASKQLLVIGEVQTIQFFTLIGAVGIEINQQDSPQAQLMPVLNYIRKNADQIGGILVQTSLAEALSERLDRIKSIDIPIVRLPVQGGKSQVDYLESLMQKAIGMKLEQKKLYD